MSFKTDSNMHLAKACVVPICEGKKFNLVHKFPADTQRSSEWQNAIQQKEPILKLQDKTHDAIRKRYFVCARHFGINSYKNIESRSLNLTAIPHLNLTNLDEYSKSKAYQLEQSQQTENSPKKAMPTILNKLAATSIKSESIIKPIKRTFDEMHETIMPISNVKSTQNINTSSHNSNERVKICRANLDYELKSNDQKIEAVNECEIKDEPKGKILALLEVNPAQYKKLLSVINSNSNVVVIDNIENDLNTLDDNEIEITVNENEIKIDKFWLRDHCRCGSCFDFSTNQRSLNILNIPDNVSIKCFELKDNKLNVIWDDDHESTYDTDFLLKNQYENLSEAKSNKILWTKEYMSIPSNVCRVSMRDYMSDPDISRKVLKGLCLNGFAFIEGVQATQQNTEFVIRQLFPIHKTLFGEMWTFSDEKKDHMDTAYTNYYLGPHNDNTYFNDASGLQILHCIMNQCTGGENFLIDGFQVAEKIKTGYPDTYERLTKTVVPAEYMEKDYHHKYYAPIINLDPITNEVVQIRFNLYDRAPLNTLPRNQIRQFYKDLKILISELENSENRISFKLEPGTVLIFDNWRVLHGRHAYDGKRTMTGCYVQRSEYMSVLRVNGFIK
ncbi:unnamed protein product [Chironomus riparius]|uniref:Trimethyllysine dioxygenase, mitochondrial n=1 Tax=Chironomus riparius TaxID=315576 RepID=A0A9N9WMJ5_9DIPT|nr:unnamed protein product [Chironomus riparius]